MTWEEWEKAYPVVVVNTEPKHYIHKNINRIQAEIYKDRYETQNECAVIQLFNMKIIFMSS